MESSSNSLLGGRLKVITGDITTQDVDAVVNAANSSLMGGGGVDGAIHRAGGPEILEACKKIRKEHFPDGMPAGEAVITTGGRLKAKHVIHTVGPVWRGGGNGEDETLADAYRRSLEIASERGLDSVAFPAISTGVYGFPKERAARIVMATVKDFVNSHAVPTEIRLVYFSREDAEVFLRTAGGN